MQYYLYDGQELKVQDGTAARLTLKATLVNAGLYS